VVVVRSGFDGVSWTSCALALISHRISEARTNSRSAMPEAECIRGMAPAQLLAVVASACGRSARTDPPEPHTDREHERATDHDLNDGVGERAAHEPVANERNR